MEEISSRIFFLSDLRMGKLKYKKKSFAEVYETYSGLRPKNHFFYSNKDTRVFLLKLRKSVIYTLIVNADM